MIAPPSLGSLGLPDTAQALLEYAVDRAPEVPAIVDRYGCYTYSELDEAVARAATAIRSAGVHPGDRMTAAIGNGREIVVAFLAAMRVGAVWVGLNKSLAAPEKAFILTDAGVTLALADGDTSEELHELGLCRVIDVFPSDASCEWAKMVGSAQPDIIPPVRGAFEPALIAYTSGTTGRPKGVIHSEHNLLLPGAVLSTGQEFGLGVRVGVCLPLAIPNMLVMGPLMTMQTSACCVVTDWTRASALAAWVQEHSIESMTLVPTMLYDLVHDEKVTAEHLASLRYVQTGGAPWSLTLLDRFEVRFGKRPVGTFGLTEAPTCVALEPRNRQIAPGASGPPNAHLRVVVVDSDGDELPLGSRGALCVGPATSGPWAGVYRFMLGYHGRPEASEEVLAGGLLHTGDHGWVDDAGDVHIEGRASELILRGGANVYPAEVELVLSEHPAVAGVAVLGLPDERLGEVVVAIVQVAGEVTDEALVGYCRSRLARYKVPARIVRVGVLPRNSMGKVVRGDVRALLGMEAS